MRLRREEVVCPDCGSRRSALVVKLLTPMEADALDERGLRELATVTCPVCGYWTYSPLTISSDARRFAPTPGLRDVSVVERGLPVLLHSARDDLGDAAPAHRDAVEDVGGVHRALLVGDDDELRAVGEAANEL